MNWDNNNNLWQVVRGYFDAMPDKENEEEVIEQVSSDAVFRGSRLWVLVFAIFIASLGLNVNSTAVIIGAMLISPLMGPIIGMGLGIGISDLELLRRSLKNYLVATAISVLTATLYFLVTPITDAQSELLARTSPTIYDVLIAFCGGAAGIIALTTRGKGNVIPGVAIATALMPPLCTAGYGLAMGQASYFFGAFYLFFINTVFICLATFLGVRMMKFRHKVFVDAATLKRVRNYTVAIVVVTMLPATYMTIQIIKQSVQENNVKKFVKSELLFKGTQIISQTLDKQAGTLDIVAVGATISPQDIKKAATRLDSYKLSDYKLNVIQGSVGDSVLLSKALGHSMTSSETTRQKLMEQSAKVHDLENQLNAYTRYEAMSQEVRGEIQSLWPTVKRLSLSAVMEADMDSTASRRFVMAVATCQRPLPTADRTRLAQWLKARTKADSLQLIVAP